MDESIEVPMELVKLITIDSVSSSLREAKTVVSAVSSLKPS
jgi:hypothetical protein